MSKLEFKNGSEIIGVDLAKGKDKTVICNVRGNRANIIIYDDWFGRQKNIPRWRLIRKIRKMC